MAFPSAGTPVQTQFASSVTSMPVNMPATVNSGDLLIALVEVRNAGTWTKPSGWTEIPKSGGGFLSQAGGGAAGKLDGFYKIAAGTEAGTTPTYTASASTTGIWQTIRVTSWHGTTPPEATTTSGDATSANPPSLTPSWGADDDLWLAIAGHAAVSAAAFTAAPTNYTGFQNNGASSGGSAASIATATRQLNASSEDPGTFTAGGSNRFWAAATIAIRPAAASGTTVTPSTASLVLTRFAPTVTTTNNVTVTPSTASLTLTRFAPTVQTPVAVTIGRATLTLTTFAPTVSVSNNQTVTPSTASLTISRFAPTVTATNNITVTPSTASLTLSSFAPTITVSNNVTVTPSTASLTLTLFSPTVSIVGLPGFSAYADTISIQTKEDSLRIVTVSDSLRIQTLTDTIRVQTKTDTIAIRGNGDSIFSSTSTDSITVRSYTDSLRIVG